MNTYNLTDIKQQAEEVNYKALLNSYCREFSNWSRYHGIPKYDPSLAQYMKSINHITFLKFDFVYLGFEVYAPLTYFSDCGIHSFHFPVVERHCKTQEIYPIEAYRFIDLATAQAKKEHEEVDPTFTKERLRNSIHNLSKHLKDRFINNKTINNPTQTFIEAEQSLILGHTLHPLPKSREGFTEEELEKYSPETEAEFPLHYFLIHPENIVEKSSEKKPFTSHFKNELWSFATDEVKALLARFSQWKVVPTHPWEAAYLLNQPDVKAMKSENLLINLGELGPKFKATSSVRTVYHPDSDWMYKFSLHVKITNSYRVNYRHELNRGYEAGLLMKTSWGKNLEQEFPEVKFITDPGFIMVEYKGKIVDGFSTSIRQNPFKGKNAKKNIGLVASLCQDGILEHPPRILSLIKKAAIKINKTVEETAQTWFKQYLNISLKPLIGIFNQYGLSAEFHQQNMLVELDKNLFPAKLYYRDNQGYLFRKGKEKELLDILPELGKEGRPFNEESKLTTYWCYYLIVNHLFGIINALGKNKLAKEQVLINYMVETLKTAESQDKTGLVTHLLNRVQLVIKANLLTSLTNMDEASAPKTRPAIYQPYPNPLNKFHFSSNLINPKGKEVVYRRYFEKEDVTITLRPVDLERDLEMLHEWFHQPHALKIWQMNWTLKELETYYRTLLPGDALHSYIGETNGNPSFNLEVYWASRDIVGAYYDVLPNDYGTHFFIAPTDPKLKYASPSTQAFVDFVFAESKAGRMVGEGSVDSMPSIMNKTHVGFKIEKIIEMPHKTSFLNFCLREWYWEKFPQAKEFSNNPILEPQL